MKCKKILKIFSLNGENSLQNTEIKENFLILNEKELGIIEGNQITEEALK